MIFCGIALHSRAGECLKPHRTTLVPVNNQDDGDYIIADKAGGQCFTSLSS